MHSVEFLGTGNSIILPSILDPPLLLFHLASTLENGKCSSFVEFRLGKQSQPELFDWAPIFPTTWICRAETGGAWEISDKIAIIPDRRSVPQKKKKASHAGQMQTWMCRSEPSLQLPHLHTTTTKCSQRKRHFITSQKKASTKRICLMGKSYFSFICRKRPPKSHPGSTDHGLTDAPSNPCSAHKSFACGAPALNHPLSTQGQR